MAPTRRYVPLVVILFSILTTRSRASAAHDRFFRISISLPSDGPFLLDQEIFLVLRATNPHKEALTYMCRREFISRLIVDVEGGSLDMEPRGWGGRRLWAEAFVRRLGPGKSLEAVYPISKMFGRLLPGSYRVVARISQHAKEFGLATGETVSNETEFRVIPWQHKRTCTRRFTDKTLGEMLFGLIETKDGEILAAWRYPEISEDWECVTPVGKDINLDDLFWAADRHACLIAVPNSIGEKETVIVVHRSTSAVESFPLRGGIGVIDRDDPFAFHEGAAPDAKPGSQGEKVSPEEAKSSGEGKAPLCLAMVCGATLGAVAGAAVVWLLMRRKRKAS